MATHDQDELPPRRNGIQPAAIIVLAIIWVLLWGELSVLIVLSGLLLGLAVTLIFPLPPVPYFGRIRPLALLWSILRLLADLVLASIEVIRTILRPGRPPRAAIIRVRLKSDSDLYQTLTAEMVSLVPGTIVIEARQSSRMLYLHVFDVTGAEDLDRVRRQVHAAEARVLRSLGNARERSLLATEEGE